MEHVHLRRSHTVQLPPDALDRQEVPGGVEQQAPVGVGGFVAYPGAGHHDEAGAAVGGGRAVGCDQLEERLQSVAGAVDGVGGDLHCHLVACRVVKSVRVWVFGYD